MFWLPVSELSAMLSCYAPGRRDSRQRGHSRRKLLTLDRQGAEQERTRKNRSEIESRRGKEKGVWDKTDPPRYTLRDLLPSVRHHLLTASSAVSVSIE